MKAELENKLVENYPVLFQDKDKPPTQTLMCFGCECSDGWYNILNELFGYISDNCKESLYVKYNSEYKEKNPKSYGTYIPSPQVILEQVKEKYGTLRVYYRIEYVDILEQLKEQLDEASLKEEYNNFCKKIAYAVDFAEYRSSITCEVTGKPGKLYTTGWHRTLCEEEAKKFNYI
jgi:hypothetical protein